MTIYLLVMLVNAGTLSPVMQTQHPTEAACREALTQTVEAWEASKQNVAGGGIIARCSTLPHAQGTKV